MPYILYIYSGVARGRGGARSRFYYFGVTLFCDNFFKIFSKKHTFSTPKWSKIRPNSVHHQFGVTRFYSCRPFLRGSSGFNRERAHRAPPLKMSRA